jgi:hypothetical protein
VKFSGSSDWLQLKISAGTKELIPVFGSLKDGCMSFAMTARYFYFFKELR